MRQLAYIAVLIIGIANIPRAINVVDGFIESIFSFFAGIFIFIISLPSIISDLLRSSSEQNIMYLLIISIVPLFCKIWESSKKAAQENQGNDIKLGDL